MNSFEEISIKIIVKLISQPVLAKLAKSSFVEP